MIDMTPVHPVHNALSEQWFYAAQRDTLLIQKDPATGTLQMYPRARVVGHPEREPEWVEASGRGTLYSFTVVNRSIHKEFASMTPFVIALVDLEEGVRITSWVIDAPLENLRCDMPLRVVFREIHPGVKMPCFVEA
ncbi:Zn-ribbon domain-containing OB-fold protein [Rhizobium sp. YTU87027]|uniref:Zn-ribbon domain-containing OB-fold protein n=1 Tax=Rhizobium sp. YTU87027 TaxID=3417741 RepID=UPI003D6860CD